MQVQEGLSEFNTSRLVCCVLTYSLIDIYKLDPNFLENEEKYKEIKAEILGEESDDEDESGSSDSDSEGEGGEGAYRTIDRFYAL